MSELENLLQFLIGENLGGDALGRIADQPDPSLVQLYYEPEPMASLQLRLPECLKRVFDVDVNGNFSASKWENPSSDRRHVFDTYRGVRLTIYRMRMQCATAGELTILMVVGDILRKPSGSWYAAGPRLGVRELAETLLGRQLSLLDQPTIVLGTSFTFPCKDVPPPPLAPR